MVDFRKWFPALAIGALVIGSAATASAQITPALSCVANAGATPLVRSEGLTELVGDVVLNCTGGTPTALGQIVPAVNIQIFLNTNVSSRLLSGDLTEALILIDDPAPTQLNPCLTGSCPVTGVFTGGLGTGVNFRQGVTAGVPNVFQGRRVLTGSGLATANSITWLGVPIDPPGTNGVRTIRITNVRADANFLGVSSGSGLSAFIPNQITEFISTTPPQALPLNNPQQTVAFTAQGLNFTVRSGAPATFLQCNSNNPGAGNSSSTGAINSVTFLARFSEGFASSFKRRNVAPITATNSAVNADVSPAPLPQDTPGGVCPYCVGGQYFTETGFYEPAFTTTNGLNRAGLADTGTRLMLRFAGVPANTSVLVSPYENGGTAATSRVRLVSTDASGATSGGGFTPVTPLSNQFAPVSLTGGAGIAVYEVVTSNPVALEDIDIPVAISFSATPNPPGLGTATVTGSFAPLSTVRVSDATSPIPRFFDSPINRTIFTINPCSTNLLFPFVTNQAGFDTGMAIANTSNDSGTGFNTPLQTGPCTMNYYSTTGSGAVTVLTAETFRRNVAAGETVAWTISSGSADLFAAPSGGSGVGGAHPGFQGYIIAQCRFQFAHGFAFISTAGAGASTGVAEGYLALVMDTGIPSRTGFASETLGE
jgi:hypothetical protein